jgi:hypothetical protein
MVKSTLSCLIFCLCLLLPAGCGLLNDTSSDFTIKICGTKGLEFSGHYSIVGTKALPEPIRAHGVIPMEYEGKGVIALCCFRKLTEKGSLKVRILKDGKVVLEAETNIPYDSVSLKTPISPKSTITEQIMRKAFGNE